ncbi:hypothetical protein K458DRAFT_371281 [Lentithecium fluviatile CBS 122367]|uniref:Cora-domain-containing protein n=1 Tax=Lentithecium fluviatile CBS 122367 TaxID=1168545 RepID=A0A6G1IVL1_9PLEO|nr:hypothetical protein K458DRAFT_371281 [Lentithecium fluviatile CBS 122367]
MKNSNGAAKGEKGSAKASAIFVTPSPEEEQPIGSWLCNEGPYRDYIEALSSSNPSLKKQDPNNKKNNCPLSNNNALVVLLDAPANGAPTFTKTEFRNSKELRDHFASTSTSTSTNPRHRIYMMEGLAKEYISIIGGHFFMDPSFFQHQERTCVWSNEFTPTSDMLPQPSSLNPERSFHLQYCELRQFTKAIENTFYFCKRTGRHVGMTPPRHKEDSTTGILRRKVSWWCQTTRGGGWDVVILCDPQLKELQQVPREYDPKTGEYCEIKNVNDLKNGPFQEGYVDFLPPPAHNVAAAQPSHPHESMLRDLIYYFQNHSGQISTNLWTEPTASSLFVKKIVAAHYLQLIDYIKVMLPSLELRLTTAWVEEQEQWKSLQTISRRCGNYRDDVEDTLQGLDYPLEPPKPNTRDRNWQNCEKDFQYIYFRLKVLKERADTLMQAMTGLASIAGNRQNLEEAKRVKRLNLLALLFIPLAYTSSLFSMQDNFAPGNGKFWVYWVCALSVVAMTLIITWVLDSALNDEAQWTVPFERFLGSWAEKPINLQPKRRKTGFYNN